MAATPAPLLATLVIGETIDDSVPLPVTIRGEDAGRQVRGSTKLDRAADPNPPPVFPIQDI
ncbi:hypothetical protein [Mesorhizobium sp. 10.2.3]|uniref:hypothetical protein n=1 Tax=Mesorhizobium sp. 10.2.3 TaxID=1085775 RepID=UPI001459FBA1|nr:hypothetical protein [Mesorhizobium sp. 10.2.3]